MTELRGLSQGLDAFFIYATAGTISTVGEWDGSITQLPSFWTVGGTVFDAINNAQTILRLNVNDAPPYDMDSKITHVQISATNADVTADPVTVTAHTEESGYTVSGTHSAYWDGRITGDGPYRAYLRYADGRATMPIGDHYTQPAIALAAILRAMAEVGDADPNA